MEVKIKRIGERKGSVGWLQKGLEEGSIYFEENFLIYNRCHGLWITGLDKNGKEIFSQYLAGYNQRDSNKYDISYKVFQINSCNTSGTEIDFVTPACRKTIMCIAQAWCKEMNDALEKEESDNNFTIKRVEIINKSEISEGKL